MKTSDLLGQSFRNVGRQKLRSGLTIFAIVIGSTSVTIMLALVTGAQNYFYQQFQSGGALQQVQVAQATDLTYQPVQGGGHGAPPAGPQPVQGGGTPAPTDITTSTTPTLNDAMVKTIKAYPHVVGVTRIAYVDAFGGSGYLQYNGQKLAVDNAQAYDSNSVLQHQFIAGGDFSDTDAYIAATNTGPIILSSAYADKLGFKGNYGALVGKSVTLATQLGYSGVGATVTKPVCNQNGCSDQGHPQGAPPNGPATLFQARVVGITSDSQQAGVFFPTSWAIGLAERQQWQMDKFTPTPPCSQSNCQPQQNQPTFTLVRGNRLTDQGYDSLVVKADSTSNVESVATRIRTLGVGAYTANAYIQERLNTFRILSLILGGIGGIALLVAAIGVVNTMVMAILERTREIGVLRAMGAKKVTIRLLFTLEAAFLGFLGGVIGVACAYGLTFIANRIINQQFFNGTAAGGGNIISLPLWLIVAVVAVTTGIGVLAGLYPAMRASRLNPIDALRYE